MALPVGTGRFMVNGVRFCIEIKGNSGDPVVAIPPKKYLKGPLESAASIVALGLSPAVMHIQCFYRVGEVLQSTLYIRWSEMGMIQVTLGSIGHFADLVESEEGWKCYGVDGEPWPVDEFGAPQTYPTQEEAVRAFLVGIGTM